MPALSTNEIRSMLSSIDCAYFIETGTYLGETTRVASSIFEKVHTIEVKEDLYEQTKKLFTKTNITCHLGDSSNLLKTICPTLDKPSCFWLDGHYSAGITGYGIKQVPLYEELQAIMSFCTVPCVVLVDDCRLFQKTDKYVEGWEDISVEQILKIVSTRLQSYSFFPSDLDSADRMSIILNMRQ